MASTSDVLSGRSFVELMEQYPLYGKLLDEQSNYEVWCVHDDLHWFIMIRAEGRTDLPYVTIEIRSNDCTDFTAVIRRVQVNHSNPNLPHPERVGTYGKGNTLRDLCKHANRVAREMGDYNFLNNNCQHFCNNLLLRLGFQQTFTTVVGTDTTLYQEEKDDFFTVVGQVTKVLVPPEIRRATAAAMNEEGGLNKLAEVYMP